MKKLSALLAISCILLAACGDAGLRSALSDIVNKAKGSVAAAPTFSPGVGSYTGPQFVTISTATVGAAIRYTTDGTTPTSSNGTVYSAPVNVTTTETIKTIAYGSSWNDSPVSSATYTIAHLYIAGTLWSSASIRTPCYWRDGTLTTLPTDSGDVYAETGGQITEDGSGNLYIPGREGTTKSTIVPCYWKNGSLTALPMGPGNTTGTMFSNPTIDSSGNFYLAGTAGPASVNWWDKMTPCYWRNGAFIALSTDPDPYGSANGIALDGVGNLYISGNTNGSSGITPCYWKNGIKTPLPASGNYSIVVGVALDGLGNLYMTGATGASSSSASPCYWKNGTLNMLPMGTGNTYGWIESSPLFDSSGSVYIAGRVGSSDSAYTPCYWKDGTLTLLPMGAGNTGGGAEYASWDGSGNLFISGYVWPSGGPCYWKNGVIAFLPMGPYPSGYASGAMVGTPDASGKGAGRGSEGHGRSAGQAPP
jgi:hypothetical protein